MTSSRSPADLDDGDTSVAVVQVALSELFTAPRRPLIVHQFMFGKLRTEPCPMGTMWTDGFNGTSKYDPAGEDKEGEQDSTASVFTRDGDGTVRHFRLVCPHIPAGPRRPVPGPGH
ncbi:hypothetical protein [Streptomyces sp. NPDC001876]|uniref:hypothetical protein n=1 Tax=Streptomyces sp. NPDC001876 TaxID=3154402 RepID=UPI00331A87F0